MLTVRRGRHEDWEGARALWSEADDLHARLAPAYFRKAAREEAEWRELLAAGDAAVFVAEAERAGVIVGVVSVRVYETPPDPVMVPLRRGHVEMLVVSRAHRRQGAAELVLTVWSGNGAAEAFYERLGYGELSRVLHAKLV